MGLLVLQSMSSFVLDSYQELLRNHLVVTLFLTMLVGAGGNAGNQSAIKVIRGLVSIPSATEAVTSPSAFVKSWVGQVLGNTSPATTTPLGCACLLECNVYM